MPTLTSTFRCTAFTSKPLEFYRNSGNEILSTPGLIRSVKKECTFCAHFQQASGTILHLHVIYVMQSIIFSGEKLEAPYGVNFG